MCISDAGVWQRIQIHEISLLINCPHRHILTFFSSPISPPKRLSAILGCSRLLASRSCWGNSPESLSCDLLPLQKQHRWLEGWEGRWGEWCSCWDNDENSVYTGGPKWIKCTERSFYGTLWFLCMNLMRKQDHQRENWPFLCELSYFSCLHQDLSWSDDS